MVIVTRLCSIIKAMLVSRTGLTGRFGIVAPAVSSVLSLGLLWDDDGGAWTKRRCAIIWHIMAQQRMRRGPRNGKLRGVMPDAGPSAPSDKASAGAGAFESPSFAEATDIAEFNARRRRLRIQLFAMRAVVVLLMVAAIVVGGFPMVLQWRSSRELAQISDQSAAQVEGWPYPQEEDSLKAARAYNQRLAKEGQPVLGEAVDPFSSQAGGSHVNDAQGNGEGQSAAAKDKEYQGLLDSGGGVMGTIRIPEISVKLPIYHGTSEAALASGSGHLYGTSLPVGGASTHSVLTGHRGLVEAMMFTRLDEMKQGDFFYIEVMGETLGYQVDRIAVIEPDDTSQLRIVPGEDRVTLMTCTPYGVNTHRLLVSGHRVKIPEPAPDPSDMHDPRTLAIWVAVAVLAVGLVICAVLSRRHKRRSRVMRHARR